MLEIPLDSQSSLRALAPENADELFALVDANRERLREWLPWVDFNRTVEDSRLFISGSIRKRERNEELTFGIWSGEQLAGVIGVFLRGNASTAEIGYWLEAESEGRGLITRAVQALLFDLFDTRGMHRVEIRCAPGNTRSRRIPERLGFRLEETLREVERLNDRYVDNCIYGLLRAEWQEARERPLE